MANPTSNPIPDEDKFATIQNSVEFHRNRLMGITPHHPPVQINEANDSNASVVGRRELNQANANVPAANRHVGWSDESREVPPDPGSQHDQLTPSASLLSQYAAMNLSAFSNLNPPSQDYEFEEIKSPLSSHESVNLSLLQSLPSPPGSPLGSSIDLNWTPRSLLNENGVYEPEILNSLKPHIESFNENMLTSCNVAVNPHPALTTMYTYTNATAYTKKDRPYIESVDSAAPISPNNTATQMESDTFQHFDSMVDETKQCEIQAYPLPTADDIGHDYETDDDLWEPAKLQIMPIRVEDLILPTPAYLALKLPPETHPYLSKASKKDCRIWLWKNAIGKKAREAIRKRVADNRLQGIPDSMSNQSTGENANIIKGTVKDQHRFL